MKLEIYDTTLRDGSQGRGISFSVKDKIRITQALSEFGIDYVEAGWPGSNPKDADLFQKLKSLKLKTKIVAFGMTCKKGKRPKNDLNIKEILKSETEYVTIVGKSWDLQVKKVLKTDLKENLRLIFETISFLKNKSKIVFFDAEHFFDGFKSNPKYALEVLKIAEKSGAERIILCDTNGGTMPWEVSKIIRRVKKIIKTPLGIHTHNDCGLAIANSLEAIKNGVFQIQGTFNGYGERCGNADLCVLLPNIQFKMGLDILPPEKISRLTQISKFIAQIANKVPDPSQPYVGRNAFYSKAGLHVDALLKWPQSYQHINPELVGNKSHISVSELSGKAGFEEKMREFGIYLSQKQVKFFLKQIKKLEKEGFHFEGAEASLELFVRRRLPNYFPPFKPLDFRVRTVWNKRIFTEAEVKLKFKEKLILGKAKGNGPVNALDNALRNILSSLYPQLKKTKLTDYKVRIIDEKEGTGASVRVLIDSSNGSQSWTTVGCSRNIIYASWQALVDSLEYPILKFYHPPDLNKEIS
jgi:2-isopropylmalate synthase